jgi:hypothetical protein
MHSSWTGGRRSSGSAIMSSGSGNATSACYA